MITNRYETRHDHSARGLILQAIGFIMLDTIAAGLAPRAAHGDRLPGMPDRARGWNPLRARVLVQVGRAISSGNQLRANCALSRLTQAEQDLYDDTEWVVCPKPNQVEQAKAELAVLIIAMNSTSWTMRTTHTDHVRN